MDETRRLMSKLLVIVIGLLVLGGIFAVTKVFMRGFLDGAVVGVVACIGVLIWMRKAAGGRGK